MAVANVEAVSYTHLDVYKRQVQELIRGWRLLTKSGRTMDTVAPVSTVNDVGLPSANPLTIKFPLVLCSVKTVCCSGALLLQLVRSLSSLSIFFSQQSTCR